MVVYEMAKLTNSQRRHRDKNRYRQCAVGSCFHSCFNSSQYCENHARRTHTYGHPEGVPITKQDLKPYLKQAREFLKQHQNHKASVTAIQILDELLYRGALMTLEAPQDKVLQELRRLYDGGLRGQEALETLCSVWLYSYYQAHRLPDDIRLTYALSRAFLSTRPQVIRRVTYCLGKEHRHYGKPGATVHSVLGKLIRDKLGIFFVNLVRAIEAEHQRAYQQKQDLAEPFDWEGHNS